MLIVEPVCLMLNVLVGYAVVRRFIIVDYNWTRSMCIDDASKFLCRAELHSVFFKFQILWVIQVSWLQWLLVMIAMTLSGAVLILTIAPAFRNDRKQVGINAALLLYFFLCKRTDLCVVINDIYYVVFLFSFSTFSAIY